MKTIYLIRHAKSCWEDPVLTDMERPLNKRGKKDAPRMAAMMAERERAPDLLVSSPAKRALRTAYVFAEGFSRKRSDVAIVQGLYDALPDEIVRIIRQLPAESEIVCLFGHNPAFTYLANRYSEERIENVPTCGIVRIDSDSVDWAGFSEENSRVKAFYAPKLKP